MKKLCILFLVLLLLFCSGCSFCKWPLDLDPYFGLVESEDPVMRIRMSRYSDDVGVLKKEDGSEIKIIVSLGHGEFFIFEYDEEATFHQGKTLYVGSYFETKNAYYLDVDVEEGEESFKITLKKVGEIEQNTVEEKTQGDSKSRDSSLIDPS